MLYLRVPSVHADMPTRVAHRRSVAATIVAHKSKFAEMQSDKKNDPGKKNQNGGKGMHIAPARFREHINTTSAFHAPPGGPMRGTSLARLEDAES